MDTAGKLANGKVTANTNECKSVSDSEYILDTWCVEIVDSSNSVDSVDTNPFVQQVHMISVVHQSTSGQNNNVIVSGESSRLRREYTEILRLGGDKFVKFKLDPGSEANILPV